MQALLAWYKDETESGSGGCEASVAEVGEGAGVMGAESILSPLGKLGVVTPQKSDDGNKAKRKGRTAKKEVQVNS
jgi:hypothetical protein